MAAWTHWSARAPAILSPGARTVPDLELVAWDFGDTLCDQTFMRIPPDGAPGWGDAYVRWFHTQPGWEDAWMLGGVPMDDMVPWLAAELGMAPSAVARHLRAVWHRIDFWPHAMGALRQLHGVVHQACVTVNPNEFSGIAAASGLDQLFDVIVVSAEAKTLSKVDLTRRARHLLGLDDSLTRTLLIDNLAPNIDEFAAAGGQTYLFTTDEQFAIDAPDLLGDGTTVGVIG